MPEKDDEFIGGKAANIIKFMPLKTCYGIYHGEMPRESV